MCFCLHFWPVSAYRFFLRLRRRWGWSGTPQRGFFIHLQGKGKKQQATLRVWKRDSKQLRGWLEDLWEMASADTKKGSVLPLSGLSSAQGCATHLCWQCPHQNHFTFNCGNTESRSGSPYAQQELYHDNATKTQSKITGGCPLGSNLPITHWIHSPFGKVVLCHWKKSSSYLTR